MCCVLHYCLINLSLRKMKHFWIFDKHLEFMWIFLLNFRTWLQSFPAEVKFQNRTI